MKVCFWRVALEQQIKPKIKTKKHGIEQIQSTAPKAESSDNLPTVSLAAWGWLSPQE